MKDKVNIILSLVFFLIGIVIIYFVPHGKDGYWFIPVAIYWIIDVYRKAKKESEDATK
ncbi:hypothetical protein PJ311_10360 [Bacillus sp. CLL-7-23]|uniref:Uncharacterized protein n=1 Tax=Bacillus changyiensis TaxID=3004103 RepID=A0ABT4X4C7_9BACI|nr:hypothetical protein [Bacillus changyiensis]MDA7027010.1 hypothetical protein [Bacillus changyiensis]